MTKRIFSCSWWSSFAALAGISVAATVALLSLLWLMGPIVGRQAVAQQIAPIQIAPGGGGFVQQFGPPRFRGGLQDGEEPADVFLPVDREVTLQWEQAKSLLNDGHYSEAVTLLDEILHRDEDFFLKPDDSQKGNDHYKHRSLKSAAQHLIGELPPEGRAAYELQFGATAERLLKTAAGDVGKLEELSRNYFHTPAGYQATLLLGRHQLDHNRPLAAAICFQRLQDAPAAAASLEPSLSVLLATSWCRAGMKDRAAEVLNKLKEKDPHTTIHVADKTVRLFDGDVDALAWLQADVGSPQAGGHAEASPDWTLVRGDAARNLSSEGGLPLLTSRWEVSTTNNRALEKALVGVRQQLWEQPSGGLAKIPAMQPLVVGNTVLMRTTRELWAVDFTTGKRIWTVRSGDEVPLEQMLTSSPSDSIRFDALNNYSLRERFWEDTTFGTLASDGKLLFLLDDLDMPLTLSDLTGGVMFNPRAGRIIRGPFTVDPQAQSKQVNKLSAYELRTQGKLKWQVGGQTGDEEPKLAGAFFLGPPLTLDGKLYVLAEMKTGEIKLCVLDAATGKLEWSQQVANVARNILLDRHRRLAGCSPSFADGVLVCPTSAQAIVGIDVANRTLLWGFQYEPEAAFAQQFGRSAMAYNGNIMGPVLMDHWTDGNPVVADGCVLVTPMESNRLFCLNLSDGSKKWDQLRGENMYVAGVRDGKVLVVGKHQFTALKLADGKLAWKTGPISYAEPAGANANATADSTLPPVPSGRGFLTGDNYFLPLSSGEVVRINLTDGKIAERSKSRTGAVPGNLICYQGEVVSQGVDQVETFFQIDALDKRIKKQLAENPEDSWALAHRGELELTRGNLDDAITDLRRAYQKDDNSYNRDLYIEVLRTALAKDFNKHQADLRDWEQLAKLDSERAVVLRVKADGLQKTGQNVDAVDALVKLSTLEPQADELDRADDGDTKLSVARFRWVQTHFDDLWAAAKPADRTKIDAALQSHLDQAAQAADPTAALRQFLRCFGNHPLGDLAREQLVDRLTGDDTLLEREQLLRRLETSTNAARKATATAKFAALLKDANQPQAALAEYKKLETLVGNQPVLNGKSVKQMLSALPADSPLRLADAPSPNWLKGEVKVEKSTTANRTSGGELHLSTVCVDFHGDPGPFFHNVAVLYDSQKQEVFGRNGLGQADRFAINLAEPDRNINGFNQRNYCYAFAQGHLLALCSGYQVFGLDTLKGPDLPGSRVKWQRDLCDPSAMNGGVMQQPMPWGEDRRTMMSSQGLLGGVGPCTANTLCYVRGRDVMAVDPLDGTLLWVRHGVEPGSDIFGDDEVTIVAPPEALAPTKPALVLRTADGKLLGERTIPMANRWNTYGRYLLVFRAGGAGGTGTVLALTDPYGQRDVWTETFSGFNGGTGGVKGTTVDHETIALMEPDGRFVMLNVADGHKLVDEKLHDELGLVNIHVLRGAQQDILVTNHLPSGMTGAFITNRGGVRIQIQAGTVPTPPNESAVMVTGRVYAFDRATGKPQWLGPASVEQHGLLLTQPADLPVVVFVHTFPSQMPNRNGELRGSVLCLDKRNGSAVCEDDDCKQNAPFNYSGIQVAGNPEKQTITIQWPPQSLALSFTDKPTSNTKPYQPGKPDKPESAKDGDKGETSTPPANAAGPALDASQPQKPSAEAPKIEDHPKPAEEEKDSKDEKSAAPKSTDEKDTSAKPSDERPKTEETHDEKPKE